MLGAVGRVRGETHEVGEGEDEAADEEEAVREPGGDEDRVGRFARDEEGLTRMRRARAVSGRDGLAVVVSSDERTWRLDHVPIHPPTNWGSGCKVLRAMYVRFEYSRA